MKWCELELAEYRVKEMAGIWSIAKLERSKFGD